MVGVDTSTIIAYIQGQSGEDVRHFQSALALGEVALPPSVLTELLSEPTLPAEIRAMVLSLPILEPDSGFWIRAGAARAQLVARKFRARLPDALIAQSCIDHDVALITRGGDFRHFAKHCGLKLA